ncbi:MAG: hypothetical protein R6U63_09125 [Longimicrobiales bacterium]
MYLWAGQATIDLHRVKFPDIPVDEEAHVAAHRPEAARELAARGVELAFLSWSWGFPPEEEAAHHEEFRAAAANYHAEGIVVLAYVQASNCVARGSYAGRDWYATTPDGRTVPYFTTRLMTCWNHPDWIERVSALSEEAIEAGADGIFFDNLWMGATPWVLGGRVGGFAGCACPRCEASFARTSGGREIPRRIGRDEVSRAYLRWRAELVTRRLGEWRRRIRWHRRGAIVVANDCDVGLRDTRSLFGLDLTTAAPEQDLLLVENVAMPRHEPDRGRLVSNALPLRFVRARAAGRPMAAVTYESGIGLDGAPSPVRARRAVAEAVAVGAGPVLKGTEYRDASGAFSVITAPDFREVREAVGSLFRWLGDHPDLHADAHPAPEARVFLDGDGLRDRWVATAGPAFATAMALTRAGVSVGFIDGDGLTDDAGHVPTSARGPVLVPPGARRPDHVGDASVVAVDPALLNSSRLPDVLDLRPVRWLLHPLLTRVGRLYFGSARVRRLFDALGLTRRFLESPYFDVPARYRAVAALIGPRSGPFVEATTPVLVERWRRPDGGWRLHLVNYDETPVRLTIHHDETDGAVLSTPDPGTRMLRTDPGETFLELELYAVLELP